MRPEIEKVIAEIEKVIAGKREVIGRILTALLADGHVLLDDVPGVGKTTLAVALSRTVGLPFRRVQFTPDVLPSDLVGFSMVSRSDGGLVYHPGALEDAGLLLGDEINRASSKTQSALLEAMEERQVTVDGETHPLRRPFLVIATQNSVGAAGTQFLPYAQVDRFLVRLSLGYPDYEAQMEMLRSRQGGDPLERVEPVLTGDALPKIQDEVRQVVSRDAILDYITRLTLASREQPAVEVGVSPRGALFLDRMAKAHAWMAGRDYVTGGDVQAVFPDVCAHRVLLKEPAAGPSVRDILEGLLRSVENPDRRGRMFGGKRP
ncbi:MAG: MoxR family ATPase [Clostridia bacterium]|nr:MoxR family ATPase [Clostridia bacterium]